MSAELTTQTMIPLRLWESEAAAEMIAKVRQMMQHALKTKGVVKVIQHAPRYVDEYVTDEGVVLPAHWLLAAEGISLCIRDGHCPFAESLRSFLCSRCGDVLDQEAYEAFVAVPA